MSRPLDRTTSASSASASVFAAHESDITRGAGGFLPAGAQSPGSRARATNSSIGSGKPFSSTRADRVELEVVGGADRVDHGGRNHHLAAERSGDDAVREVDVGAEVVPVAVDGAAVVDADAGLRPLLEQRQEADRPLRQRHRVGRHDHHLVADRLHDQRLRGERRLDRLDEPLDQVERLLVALLLGVADEPGQVDEAEGHLHAAHLPHAAEVDLHVADHVLLDVEAQVALVDVLHQRRGQRQQVPGQALHLLRHLERIDPLADQRLMHVEVEQPHLGLGDLANRLRVHADQLQQRDEREPGAEDGGHAVDRVDVLLVEGPLERGRRAQQGHHPLDQLLLEAGAGGGLGAADRALPGPGDQVLDVAEREPAVADGGAQLIERVAALAHSRHDPRLRRGRRGPAPAADRDHPRRGPALERRRRDAGDPSRLAERDHVLSHWQILGLSGGPNV